MIINLTELGYISNVGFTVSVMLNIRGTRGVKRGEGGQIGGKEGTGGGRRNEVAGRNVGRSVN